MGQSQVAYTWDNTNRLTALSQGSSSVGLSYDNANRRTCLTLPNGVLASYGYDTDSRVTSLVYGTGGSCSSPPNNLGNLTYTYDADGRRTATAGSLAAVTLPANVTTTSYNADNEQSTFNGTSLSYDANGNLTSDGTNTYTWDARNHLTQITQRRTTVGSFVYDAFGRRMSKTISGTTTQFLYDGLNPVQELNGTNGVVANLLTGLRVDEFFSRTDTATSTFLADALGSTVGLVGSGGTIATSYAYQPFGGTTVGGSANGNSYQFTGRENDGTGLYFYRARYYSPTFQRFIAQDPIGFAGGVNLYAYALNNPSSWIDPYGYVTGDKTYGLPSDFWNWYHRQIKQPGDPDLDKDQANWWYNQWQQEGQPDPEGHRTKKGSSNACSATPPPEPWTPQAEHPPFPWGQSTVPGIPPMGPDLPPASIPGGISGTVPGGIPGQVEPIPAL